MRDPKLQHMLDKFHNNSSIDTHYISMTEYRDLAVATLPLLQEECDELRLLLKLAFQQAGWAFNPTLRITIQKEIE